MKKFIIPLVFLASISMTFAQTGGAGGATGGASSISNSNINIVNPLGSNINTLPDLLKAIINNILLPIGSVIAVIMFIWSGFLFVTAQGREEQIKTARKALLYTAIGTAILLGAAAIANVLSATITSLQPTS